jgi:hypothetical protein
VLVVKGLANGAFNQLVVLPIRGETTGLAGGVFLDGFRVLVGWVLDCDAFSYMFLRRVESARDERDAEDVLSEFLLRVPVNVAHWFPLRGPRVPLRVPPCILY